MKAKSILLLGLLLVLCGCTSKMTCKVEKNGYTSTAEITLNKDEVKEITVTNIYNTAEQAKSACGIFSLTTKDLDCNDKTVVIKNYQSTLNISSLSKDKVVEHFEINKYTCK